ncbi:MAG: transcriptional regulator [Peptococcaceae bacterium]|jgi:putative FmdB family regulatory protein|nr:transcriptional regulator [Peptococcaceae bacterium]
MHYSYRCPLCGVFTLEQGIKDEPAADCPHCGQPIKRIIGKNVNILYRTTGFYCTDNGAQAKARAEAKAGGEGKAGGEAKAGGEDKAGGAKVGGEAVVSSDAGASSGASAGAAAKPAGE